MNITGNCAWATKYGGLGFELPGMNYVLSMNMQQVLASTCRSKATKKLKKSWKKRIPACEELRAHLCNACHTREAKIYGVHSVIPFTLVIAGRALMK